MAVKKIDENTYLHSVLRFQDRQAGVSLIYDYDDGRYSYNVYCLETKIMKELASLEFDFLEEALECLHDEFGTWDLMDLGDQKGCGSCAAK